MNSILESYDHATLQLVAWIATGLTAALALIFTVHHCGLKAWIRVIVITLCIGLGFSLVRSIAPIVDEDLRWGEVETSGSKVTTPEDLLGIQAMVMVYEDYLSGMIFLEDGEIDPITSDDPVERIGNPRMYAVKFNEQLPGSTVDKLVVYSGTVAEIEGTSQFVEVISSGDGKVLVVVQGDYYFVDPSGPQGNLPVRVEEIVLSAV